MSRLRLVLGDQLNLCISSLEGCVLAEDVVFLCECQAEATYIPHHPQKIALVLAAMRHFALLLQEKGFRVAYVKLEDKHNTGTLRGEIERALRRFGKQRLVATLPAEYGLQQEMLSWAALWPTVAIELREDTRFWLTPAEFKTWATSRKHPQMGYFYTMMRKKFNVLMHEGKPVGGQWSFDTQNRKSLPKKAKINIPKPYRAPPDTITQEVIAQVGQRFGHHFGSIHPEDWGWAVTHAQAHASFEQFFNERLPLFGDFQDAMANNEPWLYHAHIGLYLNIGLLLPRECVAQVENAYQAGRIPLASAEGFIRQVLGWREYVRGIYWWKTPSYGNANFLKATRALPDFFWSGQTTMRCVQQCLQQTHRYAYAHHIQRLMVLGNFLLLTGVDPKAAQQWYWIVYADAYEWVEQPNVVGMALYADGGLLASKPYAASGRYIQKMSNYCEHCVFQIKEKTGPQACPFNYLYWYFFHQHRQVFENHPRLPWVYRQWDRMSNNARHDIIASAEHFLATMNNPPAHAIE